MNHKNIKHFKLVCLNFSASIKRFRVNHQNIVVVSTVASGILFARFPTVECVLTKCSFLLTSSIVEARNKRKSAALNVLLPMNVVLGKEWEENNSPTHRKWTFLLDWNFCEQLWRHYIESLNLCNALNCRKTSKKNARCYSQDYYY